jgi:hypothetical protein
MFIAYLVPGGNIFLLYRLVPDGNILLIYLLSNGLHSHTNYYLILRSNFVLLNHNRYYEK